MAGICRTLIQIVISIVILSSLPFTLLFLTPIYIFRFIVSKIVPKRNSDFGKILTTKGTCVGVDDIYGAPQWTLLLGIVLKGRPSYEGLKRKFSERVLESRNARGELSKPELRQYVTKHLGFLFWNWDKEFNIDNHIHQNPGDVKYDVLNEDALFKIGQTLIYKPYTSGRSPWELIFLDNFESLDGKDSGSAILLRAHHVLADGFSLLKLFVKDLCQSENLEVAEAKYIPGPMKPGSTEVSNRRKLLWPLKLLFRGPYDLASAMIDTALYNRNPWHIPERLLTRNLNSAYSFSIEIEIVKEVKRLCNSSFASVLLTAYAGALRKFMAEAGFKVPSNILCAIALPMPNHPAAKLRNHATGVLVRLPTGLPSALERLRAVDRNLLELKTSTLPITIFVSMTFTGGLFHWMTRHLTNNTVTTAVGSIFPGPNIAMSGYAYTALGVTYAGGLTRGNTGLGFSCLSYNGKLTTIVGVDEGLVPESKLPATKLIEYMLAELEDLKREVNMKSCENV